MVGIRDYSIYPRVISPESITSSCPLSWRRTSRPDSSRFIAVPVMMKDPRLTETFFPNKSVLSFHFLITECPPSAKKKRYSRSRVVSNDRITASRFIGDPFTILREVAVFFQILRKLLWYLIDIYTDADNYGKGISLFLSHFT